MSDQQLAWMVAAGDTLSLEELYDRHIRRCFSLAYRMLRVADSAESAAQDVFLGLWNNPGAFSELDKDLVSWLLNETHSRCLRILRSQNSLPSPAVAGVPTQVVSQDMRYPDSIELGGPAVRVPLYATSQHPQHELQNLRQDHLQVLDMAYFEGLSQQQIAEKLGQPQATVAASLRIGLNIQPDAYK